MSTDESVTAIGTPDDTAAAAGAAPDADPDIAGEHQDTAVDKDITAGQDDDAEPESPGGWSGLEKDGGRPA